jgi:hypothetical protein
MVNGAVIDLTVAHTTFIDPANHAISFGGPQSTPPIRFTFRDNVTGGGLYGVKGPGLSTKATFAAFMPTGFVGNVITTIYPAEYPAGNGLPSNLAGVGFTGPTDPRLAPTSKYKSKATDGRDPGADVDAVMRAIAGVVIP